MFEKYVLTFHKVDAPFLLIILLSVGVLGVTFTARHDDNRKVVVLNLHKIYTLTCFYTV